VIEGRRKARAAAASARRGDGKREPLEHARSALPEANGAGSDRIRDFSLVSADH
jgi:hypothetical protein